MKKQNNALKITVLLIAVLAILLPLNTLAQEGRTTPKAKWVTNTIANSMITGSFEDIIIIDNKEYTYNDKTSFFKKEEKRERKISIDQITFPCRSKITYNVFTVVDELHPYNKGQRILTRVTIF